MDKLWAPWRASYITTIGKKTRGCIFCRILKEKKDRKNYIFLRGQHAFAVLNIFPYGNGHVLVMPYRHVNDLDKLTKAERENLLEVLMQTKRLIKKVLNPGGFNVGLNLGRVAGAGVPGHVHLHVVPRWRGDVNFMPVISNTRIISQSLEAVYGKLVHANTTGH